MAEPTDEELNRHMDAYEEEEEEKENEVSMWDWLPLEIQNYIMSLMNAQLIHDIQMNFAKKELLEELKNYFKLKKAWGLGHIQVKIERCLLRHCPAGKIEGTDKHTIINGFYMDHNHVLQKEFLGYTYSRALGRIHMVKSIINIREIFNLEPSLLGLVTR